MKKNFCTITPTRGDRNDLLYFTISRLPVSVTNYVIDYPPTSDAVDIVPRIKEGIEIAKKDGFEFAFIVEDDDYYPLDFFSNLDFEDSDFLGFATTTYYNLKNRSYQQFTHPERSSLFCTGFRISALDNFIWPPDHWKFLDIRLWEHALTGDYTISMDNNNPCIGIKHGMGKCAGKGHSLLLKQQDNNLNYLQGKVDENAFEFYKSLINKL